MLKDSHVFNRTLKTLKFGKVCLDVVLCSEVQGREYRAVSCSLVQCNAVQSRSS